MEVSTVTVRSNGPSPPSHDPGPQATAPPSAELPASVGVIVAASAPASLIWVCTMPLHAMPAHANATSIQPHLFASSRLMLEAEPECVGSFHTADQISETVGIRFGRDVLPGRCAVTQGRPCGRRPARRATARGPRLRGLEDV